jgi:SAM-dependent methyltransferase
MHDTAQPLPWIERHCGLARPAGNALDLAAGGGRHARLLAAKGFAVTALDRDVSRLGRLPGVEAIQADLEDGSPWPLPGRRFDLIVVTNYLHRPLFPALDKALAPGGVLLYETFALGNEKYGKPSNPAFLLRDGELLELARHFGWRVIAYEAVDDGKAVKQRLAAQKA